MRFLVFTVLFTSFMGAGAEASCGLDGNSEVFTNRKKEEVALQFPLEGVRGELDLVDATKAKEFIDENFRLPRPFMQTVQNLQALEKARKLNWIGVDTAVLETPKTIEELQKKLKKAKVKKSDIETVLLIKAGPVAYFQWKNPNSRARVVALAASDQTEQYMTEITPRATRLLKNSAGSGLKSSEVERVIEINMSDLFGGRKQRSSEYAAFMAKVKSPQFMEEFESFRRWVEMGVDAIAARESRIVNSILLQKGHGAIVLSKAYGAGVTERLAKSCQAPAK